MKFILGQKKHMTQIFREDGIVVPVTVIAAEKNVITQVKTIASKKTQQLNTDGYVAVQVGSGVEKKTHRKSQQGHLSGLIASRWMREFRFTAAQAQAIDKFKRGLMFGVEIFRPGDNVRVTGVSKGKGFQGVVKRHGFHGAPKSHGTKDQLRMPGSIGAKGPAHVFKGTRMPGRMGGAAVTVTGLHVIKVDTASNLLYLSGAVPGAYNGLVIISGPGTFKIKNQELGIKIQDTKKNTSEDF